MADIDFTRDLPGIQVARGLGLDPRQPYEQAAAGAKEAQAQANALSELQWKRQMMGLQGALGFQNNLQQLYNSIYSPGGGAPAAGGGAPGGPDMSAMMALSGPPPAPAAQEGPGLGDRLKGFANSVGEFGDKYADELDAVPSFGSINRFRRGEYAQGLADLTPAGRIGTGAYRGGKAVLGKLGF